MSETKKNYYHYALEKYLREGEDMIIWSVYNGKDNERTKVKIKDLDNIKIKEGIIKSKNYNSPPIRKARIEILSDVLIKRRFKKLEKICLKLETK